jgi:hypothetical protein
MDTLEAQAKWLYRLMSDRVPLTSLLGTPPTGLASNIYQGIAPQDAPFLYVVFHQIPGMPDTQYGDGTLAMASSLFMVKVVGDTNDEKGVMEANREVYAALHQATDPTYNGYVMNCLRQEGNSLPLFDDKQYRQAGGRYVVMARPLVEL